MSSVIKVNASVYSRIGYGRTSNTSSFYMNGKFTSEHHIENAQASMENRGSEYLFAVADNMDSENDQDTQVSILKEVGRFHEKMSVSGGDIHYKTKELESRVNDAERLLSSFLEMNRVPMTDTRWNLGFSALLLSEGQFVAFTGGSGRAYMMREGMFKPLASESTRAKRAIDAKPSSEFDEIELPGEEKNGSVIVSDLYDLMEGDSFILINDGLIEALGEEKIEDLLALRSDSAFIAYRLVDEAMKRKHTGDLTALVVQIEKIVDGPAPRRAPARVQTQQNMKDRVDKLKKAPAVTYKYNKRNSNKYQGIVFVTLVVLTVAVLMGVIYLIISSLMNSGKNNYPSSPTTTATATPTATPIASEEPSIEPTPTPEATPTPAPEIVEHKVKSGESINSITRKYYGDTTLMDKLCKYNDITDPNKIKVDQIIKIPSKEVLMEQ